MATKKTGAPKEARKKIEIRATVPETLSLTTAQKESLARALKVSAETFIEGSKLDEHVVVIASFEH